MRTDTDEPFSEFNHRIKKAVKTLGLDQKDGVALDLSRLTAEAPRDPAHGDIATNAAMLLAKPLGQNPRALADLLAVELRKDKDVAHAEAAGPGFLNLSACRMISGAIT